MNVLANADALARVYAAAYNAMPPENGAEKQRSAATSAVWSFVQLVDKVADQERQRVGARS